MALRPHDTYGMQVDITDPAYPLGKARNATAPGDGTGFPLERRWINDLLGFEQALLAEAEIEASGLPDAVGASQYLEALLTLFYRRGQVDGFLDAIGSQISALQSSRVRAASARYGISTGSASPIVLSADFADDVYSLSNGSTRINVGAAGRYNVDLFALVDDSGGSRDYFNVNARVAGSTVLTGVGFKYATINSGDTAVRVSGILDITDPGTQYIDFTLVGVGGSGTVRIIAGGAACKVSIHRVSA